jgi:uncharacterized protein (TIGR02594 family)
MFAWLRHLLTLFSGGRKATPVEPPKPEEPAKGDPAWLKLARAEIGTKEEPGAANNPAVLAYYRDAGHPEINADSVAWCAAFTGAMLERSGHPGSKQLNARSYLTWGKEVSKPSPGCVAVFSRGDPRGWEGHVAFYVGETANTVKVLGGNQGDAVTIAEYPKSRLLGYRVPVTAANSRTLRASAAGVAGDVMTVAAVSGKGIVDALPDALALSEGVKSLAAYWPWFAVIGITLSILARAAVVYARVADLTEKGR